MIRDFILLSAMCVSASLTLGTDRAGPLRFETVLAAPDSPGSEVTATLPHRWSNGDAAVVLIGRNSLLRREASDDAFATLLDFGVAVVGWPGRSPSDMSQSEGSEAIARAAAQLVVQQLGAGPVAVLEVDRRTGLPWLVGLWPSPTPLYAPGGAGERLDCALDSILAARGHDAIVP